MTTLSGTSGTIGWQVLLFLIFFVYCSKNNTDNKDFFCVLLLVNKRFFIAARHIPLHLMMPVRSFKYTE